jgi:hypothetical protein
MHRPADSPVPALVTADVICIEGVIREQGVLP